MISTFFTEPTVVTVIMIAIVGTLDWLLKPMNSRNSGTPEEEHERIIAIRTARND